MSSLTAAFGMTLRRGLPPLALLACLLLAVRAVLLEPFIVPSGSMAPTLLGHHWAEHCPRCGYLVRVGYRESVSPSPLMSCPNCGQSWTATVPPVGGDRILVDKAVFELREPQRWEVVVFAGGEEFNGASPRMFVKRVVGLPGETVRLLEGDVYVDGEICRKSPRQMRAMGILLVDMDCVPQPHGWQWRWLVEPSGSDPRLPGPALPPQPADAAVVDGATLLLDAAGPQEQLTLTYRHWDFDAGQEQPLRAWNSYNGPVRGKAFLPPLHDFRLECEVEPEQAGRTGWWWCALDDGADQVVAELPLGEGSSARLVHPRQGVLASGSGRLLAGRRRRVELAFIDRRVVLTVDGETVAWADLAAPVPRRPVSRPLQLGVRGGRVRVRHLRLYGDVYYTAAGEHATSHGLTLPPGHYFVLGDNSPSSHDSRSWTDPAVPRSALVGKPFFIHQPLRPMAVGPAERRRWLQRLDWSRFGWLR